MLPSVIAPLQQKFRTWALRRNRIVAGSIVLTQRSIYIIPTRQGLMLLVVLLLMLLGNINYNLSLGYVLTFLLAMMGVMSMLHAFRNLAHLEIHAGKAASVFCGESAHFNFHFRNSSPLARYRLCLFKTGKSFWAGGHPQTIFNVPARDSAEVQVAVPATRRGWMPAGRMTLYTEYPLGLFHAWTYLQFDAPCLVYPAPLPEAPLPVGTTPNETGKLSMPGDEDFSGLRKYQTGDALPRIAWKVLAREQGLQVKQFTTPQGDELMLDLNAAPDPDMESKLSRLTRWVLDAEAAGLRYGLRLPDGELPASQGMPHRADCLRRIALYGLAPVQAETAP